MKFLKIIFLLAFAVSFYSCEFNNNPSTSTSAKVNRKVLVELSTNVNCVHCPPSGHYLDLIDTAIAGITSSDTNVITLRMHSSIFAGDPFYLYNVPVNSARQMYYFVLVNPSGYLNGAYMPSFNSQTWTNSINSALAQNETQSLSFTNTFDSTTGNGTISLNIAQISGSTAADLMLHVAIVESGMYYGGGTNGERWFNNILRDLITGANGTAITLPYSSTVNYTLKAGIIPSKADIIVFTQSQSTKEVFVVGKKKFL
ncbi:MAG: hypothetical protein HY959_05840 [Ignavibacteriae bacterium]|nr:hypothetical protein [Ignavibacteriota bacterium]